MNAPKATEYQDFEDCEEETNSDAFNIPLGGMLFEFKTNGLSQPAGITRVPVRASTSTSTLTIKGDQGVQTASNSIAAVEGLAISLGVKSGARIETLITFERPLARIKFDLLSEGYEASPLYLSFRGLPAIPVYPVWPCIGQPYKIDWSALSGQGLTGILIHQQSSLKASYLDNFELTYL